MGCIQRPWRAHFMIHAHSTTRNRAMRKTVIGSFLAPGIGAAFLVALPTPAPAPTSWFVRTGGAASNDCQSAAPAAPTITAVLGKATFAAGDSIDVGAGTFNDH